MEPTEVARASGRPGQGDSVFIGHEAKPPPAYVPDHVARFLRYGSGSWRRPFRHWSERRSLRRVLVGTEPIGSVLDCPCGPGRTFWFWKSRELRVVGVERSPLFGRAAEERLQALGLQGRIIQGDMKDLRRLLPEKADLAACIRFSYYFDPADRSALLRLLASASKRYVLARYKTSETWKGRHNLRRGLGLDEDFASLDQIRSEFAAAGLRLISFVPHGPWSDRALALGELQPPPRNRAEARGRGAR